MNGPFEGLHGRIEQLKAHHDERLAKTLDACTQPRTVTGNPARSVQAQARSAQYGLCLGEALAHINHLWHKGELERACEADGVYSIQEDIMPEFAIYPSLKNKPVVITGGASGIGEQMVSGLCRTGGEGRFRRP